MMSLLIVCQFLLLATAQCIIAQDFVRSELPTPLIRPWEMLYGADGYLWISESGGVVARVHPESGEKQIVFTAKDYSWGDSSERHPYCHRPNIAAGTLGLALHPDFPTAGSNFIYYVYSSNHGSSSAPMTRFKIVRLTWDAASKSVVDAVDLVKGLPSGYDHPGGRLLAIRQAGKDFLYYAAGDGGLSDDNDPGCYPAPAVNPNTYAQDPAYANGKFHRFTIDGGIPDDNPIPGNSMFTRGHRNPQGLVYNSVGNVLYGIEHGDRTDDEINVLEPGMNYGWKDVRGHSADDNYPGEAAFVRDYKPHPLIANDALKDPLWSWCAAPQPTTDKYLDWCTVAPSDGVYYASDAIPGWKNSLLVVTLKDGVDTDKEVYQFALSPDGRSILPGTSERPNPRRYFSGDQDTNGRLRDIAVSPDGMKIYLINNGGASTDKITVYTYAGPTGVGDHSPEESLEVYPNPVSDQLTVRADQYMEYLGIYDLLGREIVNGVGVNTITVDMHDVSQGSYVVRARFAGGVVRNRSLVKQ
ncbi:MAG: T9SS type A sorting domain-containing protein [Candidatus Kapabacteria bacterium]|nr:T9SS type A sorting domain-containing protein [Candidatus Kapabacteria bacterium]